MKIKDLVNESDFADEFLKVDYRFVNTIECCGDDFDYYSHAYTVAVDFDFDYENQIPEYSKFYFTNGEKIAPVGFSGSGLLAAPFLFIGNILDELGDPNILIEWEEMCRTDGIFDLITARAFSSIKNILNLTKNNSNKKTQYLLLKGTKKTITDELNEIDTNNYIYEIINTEEKPKERNIVVIKKTNE